MGQLYLSTLGVVGQAVSCSEYDANGDGGVDGSEAYIAYIEYTEGLITAQELADVYACPPLPTPTPTPTNTPTPTPTPLLPPVVILPPPGAPANLHFTSWNGANVNLRWNAVAGAGTYQVAKRAGGSGGYVAQGSARAATSRVVLLPERRRLCADGGRYAVFSFQVRAIGDGVRYASRPGAATTLNNVNIPCNPVVTVEAVASTVTIGQPVRFRFTADPPPLLGHDEITVRLSNTLSGGALGEAIPLSVRLRGRSGTHTLSLSTDASAKCQGGGSVGVRIEGTSFSSFAGIGGQGIQGAAVTSPYGIGTPRSAVVTIQDDCTPPPPPLDKRGTVTLSDTTPQVGTAVTATLTDPDRGITNLTWQWQRLVTGWGDITGARSISYTPVSADVGYRLRAAASYDDGHGPGKRAASAATATPTPLPVITIERQSPEDGIVEGNSVRFTVRAQPAPRQALKVNIDADIPERFRSALRTLTSIPIPRGAEETTLTLHTAGDRVDEPDGVVMVTVLAGRGYLVGSPDDAEVPVLDDDLPSAPTGLAANGHIDDGMVSIWWQPVPMAATYDLRYAVETCPDTDHGKPSVCTHGAWSAINALKVTNVSLGAGMRALLRPSTLYRLEVRANNATEQSPWSELAFIYPTSSPPTPFIAKTVPKIPVLPEVATAPLYGFQATNNGVHEFSFAICDNSIPKRRSDIRITSATQIGFLIERWESAPKKDSTGASIIRTERIAATRETCTLPRGLLGERDHNSVLFTDDLGMEKAGCKKDTAPACWWSPTRYSVWLSLAWSVRTNKLGLVDLPPILNGTILLRHDYMKGGSAEDWLAVSGECSRLTRTILHEAGHALGIGRIVTADYSDEDHPRNSTRALMSEGHTHHNNYCSPQAYDIVALMANYQSR